VRQALIGIFRRVIPDWLLRVIRRRRIARLVTGYSRRIVTHTYWRWRLKVELADPMAEGWYDHDLPEAGELQALEERGWLVPNATVFDLGAHQGVVALMMSRAVGPNGKVVAIEAGRHNVRVAERNRDLNGAANLHIVHAAAAAAPGVLNFDDGLNGSVNGSTVGTVEVRSVSVDELAAEHGHPAVVFVDVEGFENQVLTGASATLAEAASAFLIEVHPDDLRVGTLAEIVAHFSKGWRLEQASVRDPRHEFVPFEGQDLGRFYLMATPAR
jgi:FkbM family methyltransferase